ncbi:Eco57I restriction-modification methylase domain-containing protein, partial [Porphyromonas gulae]
MANAYTPDALRILFQSSFNLEQWYSFLQGFFHVSELKEKPERIIGDSADEGYYLGSIDTTDSYRIGLFHYKIKKGSVVNKRVGLRNLVKSFINPTWGEFDAALVVFDDGNHWRLSFISDLKGDSTAPKRYTFVFGEAANCYNTAVSRFVKLQGAGVSFSTIKEAFSVEALTKEFYNELFAWYQWAVSADAGIYFPNDTNTDADDFEDIDKKIIRLLTRLIFVWFIKQKGLVSDRLFDENYLKSILQDFVPESMEQGSYYNAILQNLFFATLNRAIEDEGGKRGFAKLKNKPDVKSLYRYAELFAVNEDSVIDLFADIPFLNGGLFECLDKTKTIDGVEKAFNYDGFSRNDKKWANGRYRHRAFIPNNLFFHTQNGLLNILKRYNFTIEENTPTEQQVALDPELLGKVFENLLGAYNPETKETARNQSGSFYTPREIVNYMVDESLTAYLTNQSSISKEDVALLLSDSFTYDHNKVNLYRVIATHLRNIKIFDPACGSGAFPMGLLNRMVDILQKIDQNQSNYELKLSIIENCIYGSDIQNIATQICKLRFFISLICDCEKDASKPNFGIPTLPNLETKFVTANSLIALKKNGNEINDLFIDDVYNPINIKKNELHDVRHEHFRAKTTKDKIKLREKDAQLRAELLALLAEDDTFAAEDAKQMAAWNPYDQNAVSPFLDPEWMFGDTENFDIVIGNPPYIQLQNNGGELAKLYDKKGYITFARTGDVYCLFYERGYQLLKERGHLCFITSNKWMRAGYGQKIREFFAERTNPMLLVDFAGVKIFESATVDTNILLFAKSQNQHHTICAVTNKQNKDSVKKLSLFVQQQHTICEFSSSESWVILSPIEQSIKRKIEAAGTPLKDWD